MEVAEERRDASCALRYSGGDRGKFHVSSCTTRRKTVIRTNIIFLSQNLPER